MKQQLGAVDIFFPVLAALVVSGTMEHPNILTVAWVGMVSSTPPTISISLDRRRYSVELIRSNRQFTVNIPSTSLYREVDYLGMVSGKDVDKLRITDLTAIPSKRIAVPLIQECPFNLECKVTNELELGEYIMFLGEVVETHIDSDKVVLEGNKAKIDIAKVDPMAYCATVREYWSLGENIGKAFSVGSSLLNRKE